MQPGERGGKWRRRRARWLMAERTSISGMWRASQAAYRPAVSTTHPRAKLELIPPTFKVHDSCTCSSNYASCFK